MNRRQFLRGAVALGLQTGNVCIPGSSNPDHIREDANVWDFELSPDEMAAIDALDRSQRFAWY